MLRDLYQQLNIKVDLFKKTNEKKYLGEVRTLQNEIIKISTSEGLDIQEKDLYKKYTEQELKEYLSEVSTAGSLSVSN